MNLWQQTGKLSIRIWGDPSNNLLRRIGRPFPARSMFSPSYLQQILSYPIDQDYYCYLKIFRIMWGSWYVKNTVMLEAAAGKTGHLAYGPYLKMKKGKYAVAFHVDAGTGGWLGELGTEDVAVGCGKVIAFKSIPDKNYSQLVTLLFEVKNDKEIYEFRLFTNGVASLSLKAIMVRRMPD